MSGGGAGPEADLVRESAEAAAAKLRFCRIAFGTGGEQAVNLSEMGRVAADMRRGTRATCRWTADGTATRAEARLAFLLTLCVEGALPGGGTVTIGRDGSAWRVAGTGPAPRCEPAMWAMLGGGAVPSDLDAARVHFALARAAADALGVVVGVEFADDGVATAFAVDRAD